MQDSTTDSEALFLVRFIYRHMNDAGQLVDLEKTDLYVVPLEPAATQKERSVFVSGYEVKSFDRDLQPKRLVLTIFNNGSSTMRDVRATLFDSVPDLITLVPDASYGDIPARESRISLNEYAIQVNGDFPEIEMNLLLEWTDEAGVHTKYLRFVLPNPIYYHKHAYEIPSSEEMFANMFVTLAKSIAVSGSLAAADISIPLPIKIAYAVATLPEKIKQISENRLYRDDVLFIITDKNNMPLNGVLVRESRYDGWPLFTGYKEFSEGGIVHWHDREYLLPISDPVLHDVVVEYGGMKSFIDLSKYDNRINTEEVPIIRVRFNDAPSMIEVFLASSSDLHVYDMIGRHLGIDYATGQIENEFEDGEAIGNEHAKLPVGHYKIVLIGQTTGEDHLTIREGDTSTILLEKQFHTDTGQVRELQIDSIETPDGLSITMGEEGISGLWRFDETEGTIAYDAGPYHIDGQIKGTTTIVSGVEGNARQFSGGYILLGDRAELRPENIFVEAWIKTTSTAPGAIFTTGRI